MFTNLLIANIGKACNSQLKPFLRYCITDKNLIGLPIRSFFHIPNPRMGRKILTIPNPPCAARIQSYPYIATQMRSYGALCIHCILSYGAVSHRWRYEVLVYLTYPISGWSQSVYMGYEVTLGSQKKLMAAI